MEKKDNGNRQNKKHTTPNRDKDSTHGTEIRHPCQDLLFFIYDAVEKNTGLKLSGSTIRGLTGRNQNPTNLNKTIILDMLFQGA